MSFLANRPNGSNIRFGPNANKQQLVTDEQQPQLRMGLAQRLEANTNSHPGSRPGSKTKSRPSSEAASNGQDELPTKTTSQSRFNVRSESPVKATTQSRFNVRSESPVKATTPAVKAVRSSSPKHAFEVLESNEDGNFGKFMQHIRQSYSEKGRVLLAAVNHLNDLCKKFTGEADERCAAIQDKYLHNLAAGRQISDGDNVSYVSQIMHKLKELSHLVEYTKNVKLIDEVRGKIETMVLANRQCTDMYFDRNVSGSPYYWDKKKTPLSTIIEEEFTEGGSVKVSNIADYFTINRDLSNMDMLLKCVPYGSLFNKVVDLYNKHSVMPEVLVSRLMFFILGTVPHSKKEGTESMSYTVSKSQNPDVYNFVNLITKHKDWADNLSKKITQSGDSFDVPFGQVSSIVSRLFPSLPDASTKQVLDYALGFDYFVTAVACRIEVNAANTLRTIQNKEAKQRASA